MGGVIKTAQLAESRVRVPSRAPSETGSVDVSRRPAPESSSAPDKTRMAVGTDMGFGGLARAVIDTVERSPQPRVDPAELEQLKKEASEVGYRAGVERAERESHAKWKERIDAVGDVLAAVKGERQRQLEDTRELVVELAFTMLCRVLGQSLASSSGVKALLEHVLMEEAENHRVRTVRLSPRDWELLGEEGRKLLSEREAGVVELRVDRRIKLGGCFVDLERGSLDARLEVQLARLKDTLVNAQPGNKA